MDPLSLEAFDLVLGPSSVPYGSDAIGGTLSRVMPLTAQEGTHLDADCRIHGSGVNEPGRNFIVTADCRF